MAKKNKSAIIRYYKRHRRSMITSSITGFVMFWLLYYVSGLSVSLTDTPTLFSHYNYVCDKLGHKPHKADDILYINVSYDNELIDKTDSNGLPLGNVDITDRQKLTEFLTIAANAPDYKAIVLDVFFESGYDSPYDSALWQTIKLTPRVVIPKHHGRTIADSTLLDKAVYSDYNTTLKSCDFVKYPLADGDEQSVAWRTIYYTDTITYHNFCGIYVSDGHLMKPTIMPALELYPKTDVVNIEQQVYNLGCDMLEYPEGIAPMIKDKIVIIGNYVDDDKHITYLGPVNGPVIHANAIYCVERRHHLIGWGVALLIWAVLSAMTYFTLNKPEFVKRFNNMAWLGRRKHAIWHLIGYLCNILMSVISYYLVLAAMTMVIYWATGQIYELLILVFVFVPFSKIHEYITNNNIKRHDEKTQKSDSNIAAITDCDSSASRPLHGDGSEQRQDQVRQCDPEKGCGDTGPDGDSLELIK